MGNLWAARPARLPILRAYTHSMSMLKPGVTTHRPVWQWRALEPLLCCLCWGGLEYATAVGRRGRNAGSSAECDEHLLRRQAGVMNDGGKNRQLRHALLAGLCGGAACVDKRVYAPI